MNAEARTDRIRRTVMILGAGEFQVPLIRRARAMGLRTVVVSPPGDYPGIALADRFVPLDVSDSEAILEAARAEGIDAVTTDQTDMAVPSVAFVAGALGLPGIGNEVALRFTDKHRMRCRCQELGIPVIEHTPADSVAEALAFFRHVGGPVVLKPVDSQGSRGVFRIQDAETLRRRFDDARAFSRSGRVIVERFVHGLEFVSEGLTIAHEYRNLVVGDSDPFRLADRFIPRQRTFPSARAPELVLKVQETDAAVVTGFGLNQGLSHGEYLADPVTGDVYLLEVGARGGGVWISSHIVPALTNLDTEGFVLATALGDPVHVGDIAPTGRACGYLAFHLPPGRVVAVHGISELHLCRGVRAHNLAGLAVGTESCGLADKSSRRTIVVEAESLADLAEAFDAIRTTIRITVATSAGPAGPVWE